MAAISRAAGDGDFIPHRSPPPIPSSPDATLSTQNGSDLASGSQFGSVKTRKSRSRAGSLRQLLHLGPAESKSQSQNHLSNGDGDVPPIPNVPAAETAPAHQPNGYIDGGRSRSFSGSRKIPSDGRTMLRKVSRTKAKAEEEKLEQERKARLNQPAPSLPLHSPLPGIDSFGGDNASTTTHSPPRVTNFSRPGAAMPPSAINSSSSPAYALRANQPSSSPDPRGRTNGEYVADSISRTESMTNRGRSSYASSTVGGNISSPRRIRRRKDPTPFNVLVIGAKNSGKTSFISFLRHSLAPSVNGQALTASEPKVGGSRSSFSSHYLEPEMDGERVGLTIWDSAGLEKNLVDLQLREMSAFVESKFEETFAEEQKVVRSPGVKDTHIHCVFLILDPIRLDATVAASSGQQKNGISLSNASGLDDEIDLQVLRSLWGKTTVIPVISKADTLTLGHMSFLKRTVWDSIKAARLDPLEALELEDDIIEEDEEDEYDDSNGHDNDDSAEIESDNLALKARKTHNRQSSLSASIKSSDDEAPYIPMSILSPDPYDLPPYTKSKFPKPDKVGRRFPWGFADPYNSEHCDFTRLRDSIFIEWRGELRDLSRSKWYENWRTSRLKNVPGPKQRVKGGVTPVSAVPSQGLTLRGVSGASNGSGAAVPRSVSAASNQPGGAVGGAEGRNGSYGNVLASN